MANEREWSARPPVVYRVLYDQTVTNERVEWTTPNPAGGFRANLHDVLDDADDVVHRGDLLGGGLGAKAGQTLLDEFVSAVLHDGRRWVGKRT